MKDYLAGPNDGKICLLFGLRHSGKATLIKQAIWEMKEEDFNRAAFIQASPSMDLSSLFDQIKALQKLHYRYVFVDEVTLLSDFIEGAAFFSDVFACSNMKIVLSGTDSLGFLFASSSSLFDRAILLHTAFIPYREFESLLNIKGIDNYIAYGGTLCLGKDQKSPFFEDERIRDEYLDSAIANNIQHSLRNYQDGSHFRDLQELYEKHELTNLINRVVEDSNHRFALDVVNEDFFSHDLGISARNLRKEKEDFFHILDKIDRKEVEETEKRLLDIKNEGERVVTLEDAHIEEIKEYLEALDLTCGIELRSIFPSSKKRTKTLFTLPGLRYAQAKALVSSLLKEETFSSLSLSERNLVLSRILNEIKGRMMEEIVLLETKLARSDKEVFKLEFLIGEFDMVISDEEAEKCEIYEIKHSAEIAEEQYRHLIDEEKLEKTRFRYGEISKRVVLYRGENKVLPNGIIYWNVEDYLKSLGGGGSAN